MSVINTPQQLAEALNENLTNKWITEEICQKLTPKEFGFIYWAMHQTSMNDKIYNILSRANQRTKKYVK